MKAPITARPIENSVARFFVLGAATGGGLGFVPRAPGTAGSLLGVALGLWFLQLPLWISFLIAVGSIPLCAWICGRASEHWGEADCQRIVLDEVLGQAIGLLGLRYFIRTEGTEGWEFFGLVVLGFVLFRVLDVVKPFPAKIFDRMKSGHGILMDDVVAGLYAALVLRAISMIVF